MDSRPLKLTTFSRHRDENDVVVAGQLPAKSLHSRNKSMSALNSSLAINKGLATNPIRRAAFADVSNTRNTQIQDFTGGVKAKNVLDAKPIRPLQTSSKESQQLAPLAPQSTNQSFQPLHSLDLNVAKSKTLLRPQRPLQNVHKALPAAPVNSHLNIVAAAPSTSIPSHDLLPARKTIIKRHTTIFRETSIGSTAPLIKPDAKPVSRDDSSTQRRANTSLPESFDSILPSLSTAPVVQKTAIVEPVVHIPIKTSVPVANPSLPLSVDPLPSLAEIAIPENLPPLEAATSYSPIDDQNIEPELYLPALETQFPPVEPALLDEKVVTPQILTELEDYWEEEQEEEFFDAQGYVTARSLRSMGGDNTTGGMSIVLAPRVTARVERELAAAKIWVEENGLYETTEEEAWDTTMVAEYSDEIFAYMRELQDRMMPNPYYMDNQAEIQWSMRSVLIDWVVQVHTRFSLLPETLFLAVNCIDRFLSVKVVSLAKLQLVGATAIYVAAKYEEINCPSVQEIAYMVDGSYTVEEILKAERFMLTMLKFEMGWPGPMSFLRRISRADDYDVETRTLAKYFLEVTLMDERFVGCVPSFLAAGAHGLARFMLGKGDWGAAHAHFGQYTYGQLRHLMTVILGCCENQRSHHGAVYDKYTAKGFKKASSFVEHEMLRGFELPPLTRESVGGNHSTSWRRK